MQISDYVYNMIYEAYVLGASDLHFLAKSDHVSLFYRIKTNLEEQHKIDKKIYSKILRFIKYKSEVDPAITQTPQDGAFVVETIGEKIFVRISTVPSHFLESLVIRILPAKSQNRSSLATCNDVNLNLITNEIKKRNGLFIFTGPTGSGKTTTMYYILKDLWASDQWKVVTLENPVEVVEENFVQININEDHNLSYEEALKYTLRQDPDVIMIGEIRDEATARSVFRAALTGHRVISTMHTKNKYGVIERFLDFGFTMSEIKSVLIGVSNQRLVADTNDSVSTYIDFAIDKDLEELITTGREENIEEKLFKYKKENKIQ